jgi:hypothetical protein
MNLMQVEPWIHNTAAELQPLGLAPDDYHQKLYFPEWLKLQNPMDLADPTKIDALRKSLADFAATKTEAVAAADQSKVKDQIAVAQAEGIVNTPEPGDNGDGEGDQGDQSDPGEGAEDTTGGKPAGGTVVEANAGIFSLKNQTHEQRTDQAGRPQA